MVVGAYESVGDKVLQGGYGGVGKRGEEDVVREGDGRRREGGKDGGERRGKEEEKWEEVNGWRMRVVHFLMRMREEIGRIRGDGG